MGTSGGAVVLVIVMSLAGTASSGAQGSLSFNGRLYQAVSGGHLESPLATTDRAQVPASLTVRFDNFVRCRAGFRSGLSQPTTFFAEAALTHQQALERALTCLFEGPGIGAAATDYVRNARIQYEWEGMASAPIEEASYAEAWVAEHPRSPFVPYLYLFAAERWRYAFEYLVRDGDLEGVARSGAKYRDLIARARSADSLIRLVANDLDEQAYLDSNVSRHPRDP